MSEMSALPIMSIKKSIHVINPFLEFSDVNNLYLLTMTLWSFINPDTSSKQPLLEPTCPITFKQVSAGLVCDSGRPRFRFWESPPSASWRRQMVQLVRPGSGSLGLKTKEWPSYGQRDAEERSREIRARTRPACSWLQNLMLWLVWLVFVLWH